MMYAERNDANSQCRVFECTGIEGVTAVLTGPASTAWKHYIFFAPTIDKYVVVAWWTPDQ